MTNQSIQPSYRSGHILPQGRIAAHADESFSQLENVSMLVIAAMDDMYGQAEAYCRQGTRSAGHQKRFLERTAIVLTHYDQAAFRVHSQAVAAILNRPWVAPEPVTRIVEVPVPQKGLIPRLFGK